MKKITCVLALLCTTLYLSACDDTANDDSPSEPTEETSDNGNTGNGGDDSDNGDTGENGETVEDGENSINEYTVSTTTSDGGTISPASQIITHGNSVEFTLSSESGYSLASVTGCNGTLEDNIYTTGSVTAKCTIVAEFSPVAEYLDGEYRGVMHSPKNIFFTDSVNISFSTEGLDTKITKNAFNGRTCELEGELAGDTFPLSGSGTFKCSDFTNGKWTSNKIAKTNTYSSLSVIEMASGNDVYVIKVIGMRNNSPSNYDSTMDFWFRDVPLEQFEGTYDGRRQTLDGCAASTFENSPSDLTISIEDNSIFLEQDSFFDGICKFDGEVDSFENGVITASGTYECSNFDEGTWTTNRLVLTGNNSMFAELDVDVPTRGCSYTVRYIGFKP